MKPTVYVDSYFLIKLEQDFRPSARGDLIELTRKAANHVTFVLSSLHLLELSHKHNRAEQLRLGRFLDSIDVLFIRPEGVIRSIEHRNFLVSSAGLEPPLFEFLSPNIATAFADEYRVKLLPSNVRTVEQYFWSVAPVGAKLIEAGKNDMMKVMENLALDRAENPQFLSRKTRQEGKTILMERRLDRIRRDLRQIATSVSNFFTEEDITFLLRQHRGPGLCKLPDLELTIPAKLTIEDMKKIPSEFLSHEVSFLISFALPQVIGPNFTVNHRSKAFDLLQLNFQPYCDLFCCDSKFKRFVDPVLISLGKRPSLAVGKQYGSHPTIEALVEDFSSLADAVLPIVANK